jgi:hypothetical protein
MAKPRLTSFLILFTLFILAVMADTGMSQEQPSPFQQMVDLLFKTVPLGNDSEELNWTVHARNNSDMNIPAPKNLTELGLKCWTYFGHPQTIRDVKGFFRWGCQPYPITCDVSRNNYFFFYLLSFLSANRNIKQRVNISERKDA